MSKITKRALILFISFCIVFGQFKKVSATNQTVYKSNEQEKVKIEIDDNENSKFGLCISMGVMVGTFIGSVLTFVYNNMWFIPVGSVIGILLGTWIGSIVSKDDENKDEDKDEEEK